MMYFEIELMIISGLLVNVKSEFVHTATRYLALEIIFLIFTRSFPDKPLIFLYFSSSANKSRKLGIMSKLIFIFITLEDFLISLIILELKLPTNIISFFLLNFLS